MSDELAANINDIIWLTKVCVMAGFVAAVPAAVFIGWM